VRRHHLQREALDLAARTLAREPEDLAKHLGRAFRAWRRKR
jgi:hypothetical protein